MILKEIVTLLLKKCFAQYAKRDTQKQGLLIVITAQRRERML